MKNVCFFNSLDFWGGGEKLHLEYALEFQKKGYNVSIAAYENGPLWQRAEENDIPVIAVSAGTLSFINPLKTNKLKKLYQDRHIDTVVFSTSQDVKFGGISAKKAGVERIVYLRGLAVPIKGSFINKYLFKHVLTHVVANSAATEKRILQNLNGACAPSKISTIYHGIEVSDYLLENTRILEEIAKQKRGIVLGNAGRLTKQKGQQHLIKVASILRKQNIEFTLFIAGTGELEAELRSEIAKHKLDKYVILLGFVKDMEAFMNSVDIFLLSSEWEGFGYVLVEAMIRSKPIVAFNTSSNPEIVKDNETGLLVDFPNAQDFANKTRNLIEDTALRNKMGMAGKKDVLARFEITDRVSEFEAFILKTSD